jgi:hypothetical protein
MKKYSAYGTTSLNNQQPGAKSLFLKKAFAPGIVHINVLTIKWAWNVEHMR